MVFANILVKTEIGEQSKIAVAEQTRIITGTSAIVSLSYQSATLSQKI